MPATCRGARRTTCSTRWSTRASSSTWPRSAATASGVAAFEVGSGYSRQEPLQRIARRLLAELVDAHRGRAPTSRCCTAATCCTSSRSARPGRPPLVTDVGVRLPAHLTASGRAILAALPAAQVRALYPDRSAFVDRHGTGPPRLSALRTLLSETRQRGYATEDGEVTPGFASVAARGARPQRLPGRRAGGHLRGTRADPTPLASPTPCAGPPTALTQPAAPAAGPARVTSTADSAR